MKEGTVVVDGQRFDLLTNLQKPILVEFRPLHEVKMHYGSLINRKLVVLGVEEGTTVEDISPKTMAIVALNDDGGKAYRTRLSALNVYRHGNMVKDTSMSKVVAEVALSLATKDLQQVAA